MKRTLMKSCTICQNTKPLTDFSEGKKYKDGHYNQCKSCFYNVYHRKHRSTNPWYVTLCAIRQRCNRISNCNYKYYGGRGIKCSLTIEDVKYLWLRDKAKLMKKPSIDRIHNNGNYSLHNCRFIEHSKNISLKWRNK